MDAKRVVTRAMVLLVVGGGGAVAGVAGEPGAEAGSRSAAAASGPSDVRTSALGADSAEVAPRVSVRVSDAVRTKVESGFALAQQHLRDVPQCGAMFADLGVDGNAMLSTTLYYQADVKMEKRVCRQVFAYTLVGGAPTWLCRHFSKLSDRRAAVVLLHEALHHAGLDEWPHDPEGMPPRAIDELVTTSCGM